MNHQLCLCPSSIVRPGFRGETRKNTATGAIRSPYFILTMTVFVALALIEKIVCHIEDNDNILLQLLLLLISIMMMALLIQKYQFRTKIGGCRYAYF